MTFLYLVVFVANIDRLFLGFLNIHKYYDVFRPGAAKKNSVSIDSFLLYNYFRCNYVFIINKIQTVPSFVRVI